jgi:hypothetical protein
VRGFVYLSAAAALSAVRIQKKQRKKEMLSLSVTITL